MSWPVYSKTFLRFKAASGGLTYTVPSGYVAVIRHIASVSLSGNNVGVNVFGADHMVWWHQYPVAAEQQVEGELSVLAAGSYMEVVHGGTGLVTTISGFLLLIDSAARGAELPWAYDPDRKLEAPSDFYDA